MQADLPEIENYFGLRFSKCGKMSTKQNIVIYLTVSGGNPVSEIQPVIRKDK